MRRFRATLALVLALTVSPVAAQGLPTLPALNSLIVGGSTIKGVGTGAGMVADGPSFASEIATARANESAEATTARANENAISAINNRNAASLSQNILSQAGVDPTGAIDSSTALMNVFTAAAASAHHALVPPGVYKINGSYPVPQDTTVEMHGTTLTGTGGINHIGDGSPFLNHSGLAVLQRTDQGSATDTVFASLYVDNTGGSAPAYEKAAGYFIAETDDPSVYGGTSRDAVGLQAAAVSGPNNSLGHIYGMSVAAIFQCGTPASGSTTCPLDGSGEAVEFNVVNYSSDIANSDNQLAKTGIGIISAGSAPSTTALHITGGTTAAGGFGWHNGIWIDNYSVEDYAFKVADVYGSTLMAIAPGGSILQTTAVIASAGSFASGSAGATPLVSDVNAVTSGAANSGVVIPALQVGAVKLIWNETGSTIVVYPIPGAGFAGYAANQGVGLSTGHKATASCLSATFCVIEAS